MSDIYYGGDIVTMASDSHGATNPEAVLVADGRVQALGALEQLRALDSGAALHDLGGDALLPGFIDGHSHIVQYASTFGCVDMTGSRSLDEVARRLRNALRERGREALRTGDYGMLDEWLACFGYDDNVLAERRHPDRYMLDRVCAEVADELSELPEQARRALAHTPVLVTHASGHVGAMDSEALRRAGITADTEIPGGHIARDAQGEPTGYAEEAAFMRAAAQVGAPSQTQRLARLDAAQREYLRHGITTAQEGLARRADVALLDAAARAGRLKLDVVAYQDVREVVPPDGIVDYVRSGRDDARDLMREQPELDMRYRGRLKLGGFKLLLDGSPQGRTAFLSQPYLPAQDQGEDYRGYPAMDDAQVEAYMLYAARRERQILVHCNGDAAIDQLLHAQRIACAQAGAARNRNVAIHAQLMRPDQLKQLPEVGLMPSYFVAHVKYWGDAHLRNLGPERAAAISPLGLTERLGIPFTLHQDTPVLPPDMLETLSIAQQRISREGVHLARAGITDASRDALVRAITAWGAYQYFEEAQKGTLEPGKRADMVRLSANPLSVDAQALDSIEVRETYVAGELAFQA